MTWLLWLSCTSAPSEPAPLPTPDHVGGWPLLIGAATKGNVRTAKTLARDLTLGPGIDEHDGAATMGAGLGFVQVAADGADIALGIGRAAAGCGVCHVARSVVAPPPPRPTHANAGRLASWATVWARPASCPRAAGDGVCDAWPDLGPVLEACQRCHSTTPLTSP